MIIAAGVTSSRWAIQSLSSSCSTFISGKTEDDLKNFALRDLGVIRTNKNANLSARFTDEAEARACSHYSRLLGRLETNS